MEKTTIKKRTMTGVVVSDAMQKTRVVVVNRQKKHAKYQRYYQVSTKFKAHDEKNEYHAGDVVIIEESRPISRDKRWVIKSKVASTVSAERPVAENSAE